MADEAHKPIKYIDQEIKVWTATGLISHFRYVHDKMPGRRFAFILGAGASITSGIPAAGTLVEGWLREMYERTHHGFDAKDFKAWATAGTLEIPGFDYDEAARSYPQIYERRFRYPREGYAYLEDLILGKVPRLGYWSLAQILGGVPGSGAGEVEDPRHNVVITTNFDNLVADALSKYRNAFAVVCGHEALAEYVLNHLHRPVVAKIHRDLLFAPQNDPYQTGQLHEDWARVLRKVFDVYTPIVLGYGGNDGSLMDFLASLPPASIEGGIFWCFRNRDEIERAEIKRLVARQKGRFVKILGFDEFMVQLAHKMNCGALPDDLKYRTELLRQQYDEDIEKLREAVATHEKHSDKIDAAQMLRKAFDALTVAPQDDADDWWAWELRARAESDPDKRRMIYDEALKILPESPELLGNCALFLTKEPKDDDAAEAMYKRAIEADPKYAEILANYAVFLKKVREDYDAAEAMFKRAIEANPNHTDILCSYANFLADKRKDHAAGEAMYQRAIQADPMSANSLGSYARFLLAGGRMGEGLGMLDRAMANLDEEHAQDVNAECWMYAYCCRPVEQRPEALVRLKCLIMEDKVRTGDWDFSDVIGQARAAKHSAVDWLGKLAEVLGGRAEAGTLEEWSGWRDA